MKPARGPQSKSHKAALLYLQGGMTCKQVAARYCISLSTLSRAIQRLQRGPCDGWPEDEVTL